jgi:signal transduction histidine kinase
LGLALVARVARQHGGSVTAHSSGKGAKFVFRLPLGAEED